MLALGRVEPGEIEACVPVGGRVGDAGLEVELGVRFGCVAEQVERGEDADGRRVFPVRLRDHLGDRAGALDIAGFQIAARETSEGFDIIRLLFEHDSEDFGSGGEVAGVGGVFGGGEHFSDGRACVSAAIHLLGDERADLAFRQRAHEGVNRLTVPERDDGRDRLRAGHLGDLAEDAGILVDVDLHHLHGAVVLSHDFFQRRAKRAARATPGRPEVDDNRHRLRRLDHVCHEGLVGPVGDVGALGPASGGSSCACADDVHGEQLLSFGPERGQA